MRNPVVLALCGVGLFVSLLWARPVLACSCVYAGGFVEMANRTPWLLEGEVISTHPSRHTAYVEFKVTHILRHETASHLVRGQHIRVAVDNGAQCLRSIEGFERSSKWIMAIRAVAKPRNDTLKSNAKGDALAQESQKEPRPFASDEADPNGGGLEADNSVDFELPGCGEFAVKRRGAVVEGVFEGSDPTHKSTLPFLELLKRISDHIKEV